MSRPDIIIAIDGHSSTGKSSFAKQVARTFGLLYLDSGALYRAVTLFALEKGLIIDKAPDFESLIKLLPDLKLSFQQLQDGSSHCFIGERDVESNIRSMKVSENVSPISANQEIRDFVDNILHSYGKSGGIIMDGRDIGTTVFPNAQLKIYMTASPQVRAQRRLDEMKMKGQSCDFAQVLENIKERDRIDSTRQASPLRRAEDAILLDNSQMNMDQEMEWIAGILAEKFNLKPLSNEG